MRVGLHSAVVWKRLYFSPLAASFSSVGILIGPPNALLWPKPMSSISTITTLGAPCGAFTSKRGGALALRASSSVIGVTFGSGIGSTVRSSAGASVCAWTAGAGPAIAARKSANPETAAPTTRIRVRGVFMVLSFRQSIGPHAVTCSRMHGKAVSAVGMAGKITAVGLSSVTVMLDGEVAVHDHLTVLLQTGPRRERGMRQSPGVHVQRHGVGFTMRAEDAQAFIATYLTPQ